MESYLYGVVDVPGQDCKWSTQSSKQGQRYESYLGTEGAISCR